MRRRTLLLIASVVTAVGLAVAAPSAFAGDSQVFTTNSKCCATP